MKESASSESDTKDEDKGRSLLFALSVPLSMGLCITQQNDKQMKNSQSRYIICREYNCCSYLPLLFYYYCPVVVLVRRTHIVKAVMHRHTSVDTLIQSTAVLSVSIIITWFLEAVALVVHERNRGHRIVQQVQVKDRVLVLQSTKTKIIILF